MRMYINAVILVACIGSLFHQINPVPSLFSFYDVLPLAFCYYLTFIFVSEDVRARKSKMRILKFKLEKPKGQWDK